MLFFGHIGITLGVGIAGVTAWRKLRGVNPNNQITITKQISYQLPATSFKSPSQPNEIASEVKGARNDEADKGRNNDELSPELKSVFAAQSSSSQAAAVSHWTISTLVTQLLPLFCCAVGSLLPDIIDKPIGHYFFSYVYHGNGRIFAHTLLFALIVLVIGLILHRAKRTNLGLIVAYGVFMHLILDFMWQTPQTLFWPLLGWSFPPGETSSVTSWILGMLSSLRNNPAEWIEEGVGLAVVLGVIGWEVKRQRGKITKE